MYNDMYTDIRSGLTFDSASNTDIYTSMHTDIRSACHSVQY